ncbi:ankyrin-related protein [Cryptosporidium ryanae]|uniref:ankyrin-related protein n=1 Tax=Cryptosporidium ryanae TaxID=515981 RepID=UPI00351A6043|nr:ankyrin-related protein [Cryptosporidium ryanae]
MNVITESKSSDLGEAYGHITSLFNTVSNKSTIETIRYIASLVESSKEKIGIEEQLIGYKDGNGRNVCHFACSAKRNDTLKALIKLAPKIVNCVDNTSENPLFISVRAKDIDSIKILLDSGVNITCKNSSGCNVLHYSCQTSDIEIVKLIVSTIERNNKSDLYPFINTCSSEFGTPLQWACMANNKEIIEYLLIHKANPNLSPFQYSIPSCLMIAVSIGDFEIIEKLLISGAEVEKARDSEGYTPIFGVIEKNDIKLLELILEYIEKQRVDVSNQVVKGETIYSYAIKNNCSNKILCCLKKYAFDTMQIEGDLIKKSKELGQNENSFESTESSESIEFSTTGVDEVERMLIKINDELDEEDLGIYNEVEAEEFKTQANLLFKENEYIKSKELYTRALCHLKKKRSELSKKAIVLKSSIFSNRCLANIKVGDLKKALFDSLMCINLNPEWSKGYFRCSQVYHLMGDVANQACYLWDAVTHEDNSSILKQEYIDSFSEIMRKHRRNNRT